MSECRPSLEIPRVSPLERTLTNTNHVEHNAEDDYILDSLLR